MFNGFLIELEHNLRSIGSTYTVHINWCVGRNTLPYTLKT